MEHVKTVTISKNQVRMNNSTNTPKSENRDIMIKNESLTTFFNYLCFFVSILFIMVIRMISYSWTNNFIVKTMELVLYYCPKN